MLATSSRLGLATDFLLWSTAGSGLAGNLSQELSRNLAERLQAAPPWPRPERVDSCQDGQTGTGLPSDLPGWHVFSAAPLQHASTGFDRVRQWPAEAVGERRLLKRLLASLAAIDAVTGFQALMRTPRAWYRWGFGRGRGDGPLGFDDGRELLESETAWRLDNRFGLWLEPGAAEQQVQEVEALVEDLQQAMEGAADAYRSGLHAYRA